LRSPVSGNARDRDAFPPQSPSTAPAHLIGKPSAEPALPHPASFRHFPGKNICRQSFATDREAFSLFITCRYLEGAPDRSGIAPATSIRNGISQCDG
jgi:hypothetical protein